MAADAPFAKLVPGFDFLQGLVKNAGASLPSFGQWVAPTLDPAEIDKRIEELRTVQFWLEQNARMLAATIQALEVQRMTLATLKTMNVQMTDLRDALTLKIPDTPAKPPVSTTPSPKPAEPAAGSVARKGAAKAQPEAAAAAVDPMQWWNALTRQFTDLAATAMRASAAADAPAASSSPTAQAATTPASTPPSPAPVRKPRAPAKRAAKR